MAPATKLRRYGSESGQSLLQIYVQAPLHEEDTCSPSRGAYKRYHQSDDNFACYHLKVLTFCRQASYGPYFQGPLSLIQYADFLPSDFHTLFISSALISQTGQLFHVYYMLVLSNLFVKRKDGKWDGSLCHLLHHQLLPYPSNLVTLDHNVGICQGSRFRQPIFTTDSV